ncbi:hypothetical protein GZ77_04480 [Endozoicomonas montiporae]|uniref:Peptidase S1 domain-containing protein n=2 Tax=Endozoicomonas montiporae TaxID=1027273 RepID=A0A081NBH3_9GAMM|nr:hypothetical protein GZ77_04480 [Endozoicomonas montiporae]
MLVDRLWVMTAAHCLDSNKGKALKKFVKLTFVNPLTDEVIVRTSRFYLVPVRKPLKNGSRSWPTEVDNGWI